MPPAGSDKTLESVLSKWIDSEGNLVLSSDVRVAPTELDPCTKLVFRRIRDSDGSVARMEYLGATTSVRTYTQMADFTYTPPAPSEVSHIYTSAVSRQTVPQQYNCEGNPSSALLEAKLEAKQVSEDGSAGAVAFLRFKDRSGPPSKPTQQAEGSASQSGDDSVLWEKVESLFNTRPVWQRASLEEALGLGPLPAWRLAGALRQVSYLFLDGPWRKCYVRFGFDPRTNPEAKRLQMIDFRDPFFRSDEGGRKVAGVETVGVDVHFRKPPTNRSQLYQLCDIDDPGIQALLAGGTRVDTADAHTGWLTEAEMDSVRNQMKIKSEGMRRKI